MALSGREVLLVLRARDEASRTLRRVSRSMSQMDRDAAMSSQTMIATQTNALRDMQRGVGDVGFAYRQAALNAQQLRMTNQISATEYRKQMHDARQARVTQLEQIRQERISSEDLIRQSQDRINAINDEQNAIRERGYRLLDNGMAATTAGAAMTALGIIGTRAMVSNIQATMDYRTEASRTLTQVDTFKASLEDIEQLGKDVADTIPVAFEQIQPALYDIFSSIDVGLRGGRKLITQFAKDAVGGTTEMSTATRANLAIMNAYSLSVKDASKVSDFMFQLVRKGVGTYDEFAKTIGRSIPSAARAGQTYQTLGGMIAFMTRNGMSAAMASTSAARALDAISHPATVKRMEELGVNVKDMKGEFLPLPKILDGLNKQFGDMTAPQRAEALQELFKGSGGTIQARRFFDAYFKNVDEYLQRTKEMNNATGAAQEAFETMAESPQAKLQQFKNDWMLLRIEIGEHLLPIAMNVVGAVNKMIDAFMDLPGPVRKGIIVFMALSAVVLTVMGIGTMLAGAFIMLAGAAAIMGTTLGTLVAVLSGIGVGIGAVIAGVYLLIANWDKIGPAVERVKNVIISSLSSAVHWVQSIFGPAFMIIIDSVKEGWSLLGQSLSDAWQTLIDSIDTEAVGSAWQGALDVWQRVEDAFIRAKPIMADVASFIGSVVVGAFRILGNIIEWLAGILGPVLNVGIQIAIGIFRELGNAMEGLVTIATGILEFFKGVFTGDWEGAWNGIKTIAGGALDFVKNSIVGRKIGELSGVIAEKMGAAKQTWSNWWDKFEEDPVGAMADARAAITSGGKGLAVAAGAAGLSATNNLRKGLSGMPPAAGAASVATTIRLRNGLAAMPGIAGAAAVSTAMRVRSGLSQLPGIAGAAAVSAGLRFRSAMTGLSTIAAAATLRVIAIMRALPGQIMAAISSLPGQMHSIGANAAASFISGIGSLAGQAASAARNMVSSAIAAARSALKIGSPSKVFRKMGRQSGDGYRRGVIDGIPNVLRSVRKLTGDVRKALRNRDVREAGRFIKKELLSGLRSVDPDDVKDVTKDFAGVVDDWAGGALRKLTERKKEIDSKIKSFRNSLKYSNLSPKERRRKKGLLDDLLGDSKKINRQMRPFTRAISRLKRNVGDEFRQLTRISVNREKVNKRLENARDRLADINKTRRNYISAARNEMRTFGGLASLERPQDVFGNEMPRTTGTITAQLRTKLAAIREYGTNLRKLRRMGFSKDIYNQIVQMGPEAGGEFAKALIQATPAQVGELNRITGAISTQSNAIATAAGNEMYLAGVRAAQGLVRGLESQKAKLTRAANILANALVKQIKKALGIRSPSRVAWMVATNFGSTIAAGLRAQRRNVGLAANELAKASQVTFGDPSTSFDPFDPRNGGPPPVGGVPPGPGGTTVEQTFNITMSGDDVRQKAQELGWELAGRYR